MVIGSAPLNISWILAGPHFRLMAKATVGTEKIRYKGSQQGE